MSKLTEVWREDSSPDSWMQIVTEEWLTSLIHKHLEQLSQSVWYLLRKLMATKNERAAKWCSGLLRSQTSTKIRGSEK